MENERKPDVEKFYSPFASSLRRLMRDTDMTQELLAQKIGKTRQTVSQYVNGINEPGYDTLVKIADFFDVSVDYLLRHGSDLRVNCSFSMAARLKQARTEMGLSHEKLSKAVSSRYGIKIHRDSLLNYEACEANSRNVFKNLGMRVEYLICLADFFGVSTDYLLGISDAQ